MLKNRLSLVSSSLYTSCSVHLPLNPVLGPERIRLRWCCKNKSFSTGNRVRMCQGGCPQQPRLLPQPCSALLFTLCTVKQCMITHWGSSRSWASRKLIYNINPKINKHVPSWWHILGHLEESIQFSHPRTLPQPVLSSNPATEGGKKTTTKKQTTS